jgi:tetratricopeptide (TPR) repeat protein
MKNYLFIVLTLFVISLVGNIAFAQNTAIDTEDPTYRTGIELFERKKYSAAQKQFEEYLATGKTDEKAIQSEYYAGICALMLQNPDFEQRIIDFTTKYPAHTKAKSAAYYVGSYYYEKGEYGLAVKYLKESVPVYMRTEEDIAANYKLAYSFFSLQQYSDARKIFDRIKKGTHEYTAPASYYAGYLAFTESDYKIALEDLEKAASDNVYKTDAYITIAKIYYEQGKCDKVLEYAEKLDSKKAFPPAMNALVGDCNFLKGSYTEADKFLSAYANANKKLSRPENYRLGFTKLNIAKYTEAIDYLTKAADGLDTLAQLAGYHLGVAYTSAKQNKLALAAFDKARQIKYNANIQEQGAYYYTKLSYDLADFSNAIAGADFYMRNFPVGKYADELQALQTEAYLNTGNYTEALEKILPMRNKNNRIQAALQKIAYNKAVLDFNDSKYKAAAQALNISLDYPIDRNLVNAAYFWLGEVYSVVEDYDSALLCYQAISQTDPYYRRSRYGVGYVYFNTSKYGQAIEPFMLFARPETNATQEQKADATLRLADCYYMTRSFDNALRTYKEARQLNPLNTEYILLRQAFTAKADNNLDQATMFFEELIQRYPNSPSLDRVYYEQAMINMERNRRIDAIPYFTKIINSYKDSPYFLLAYSKRALAQQLQGNNKEAAEDYRKILDQTLAGDMAKSAMKSLQEIQRNTPISWYDSYFEKYKNANPNSDVAVNASFQDVKAIYDEALSVYDPKNSKTEQGLKRAIDDLQKFISQYPSSEYLQEAYFMLGISYRTLQNNQAAIDALKKVRSGSNMQRATRALGDLAFAEKDYTQAIQSYEYLRANSTNSKDIPVALSALLKSYFEVKDYAKSEQIAAQILSGNFRGKIIDEATLYKGKIAFAKGEYEVAKTSLAKLSEETQSELGAEAYYTIGNALRAQKEYQKSADHLTAMPNKFASYGTWNSKAFLIICENYLDLDNVFQAKAALNVIINSSKDPEIVQTAKNRLEEIEQKEKK